MKCLVLTCFTIFLSFQAIECYKILAVLPLPARSHFNIGNSIAKVLLDAGHEVTLVHPFPMKNDAPRRRDIVVEELQKLMDELQKQINPFELGKNGPFLEQFYIYTIASMAVNATLSNEKVKKLLNSGEKFDAVIYEVFGTDALGGLGQHLGCPTLGYTTFGTTRWANQITGNPDSFSTIANPFLGYTAQMTFAQRVKNVLFSFLEKTLIQFYYFPLQRRLYHTYFPNSKSTFENDMRNLSILFMNDHYSQSSVRHYLPNMIEISGVHVHKQKPLPEEWQKFLDNAKEGVVFFSMGSMIESKNFPVEKREAFTKAFSKLKQKVIWKYEEDLPNQPKNVKTGKWLPQRDILAHPNVKLFVTHGGLLGTTESIVVGKPVLGIPIYGDQKMNIARAIEAGYGAVVDYENVSEEALTEALQEMLTNPKYYETAQKISNRFNDRPMTPHQSVVYWTEFVIRHQGAPHLKSPGNNLNAIQYNLIDVYAFLCVIFLILSFICFKTFSFMIRKCCGGSQKNNKKVKKN